MAPEMRDASRRIVRTIYLESVGGFFAERGRYHSALDDCKDCGKK